LADADNKAESQQAGPEEAKERSWASSGGRFMANPKGLGRSEGATHRSGSEEGTGTGARGRSDLGSNSIRDTNGIEQDQVCRVSQRARPNSTGGSWWSTESDVGRVANGVPARVDRVKSLGNSVVPAQARAAFERLTGLK
jgi:DNA (cytosine-5)-methyltransferase 1